MVRKKDGKPRMCIDFRKLNANTKFDAWPLARIDEALDMLGKAKVISTLDQKSAFWSIAMHNEDKEKTAFGTRKFGLLQFKRMPFGLKNATATYSRAVAHVLRGLIWQSCVAYVDDTIVMGEDHEDHLNKLDEVLKSRIRQPVKNE